MARRICASTANAKLSDSAYYNSKGIPSEPVSAVEKRREHDEFRKHEDRRREEQDEDAGGNLTRQEGAEFAAREARCSVVPSPILATSAGGSQRSSFVDPHFYEDVAPLLMPIESSTRNCATTPTSLKTPISRAPQAAPPPPPAPVRHIDGDRYPTASKESARITRKASDPVQVPDLKTHSTSYTCTMDEEELVLQLTEERSLITLGWRMLPESFAVVCAPKFTPKIFRLTDPPGLQTILDCSVKEAFHPHPEVPIYTDTDKGHVQIKDVPLEIVDLR
ncbi:hypothetical protein C8R48DRAFT_765867 [Suillus tomentosus]|nr:hypothetical protein C8R48DRAFT_765867 [Suillus tomentosus]